MSVIEYPYMIASPAEAPDGARSQGRGYLLEDAPRIAFYCAPEPAHDDPVLIEAFVRRDRGAGHTWEPTRQYPTRSGIAVRAFGVKVEGLVGDQPIDVVDAYMQGRGDQYRARYRMRCPKCGERVTRRGDQLSRDLDRLWGAGMLEVALTTYRAKITSA